MSEKEGTEDEVAEENGFVTIAPENDVAGKAPTLDEDTNAPEDTGCEFFSIIATGEGDPELLLMDDE